MRIFAEVRLSDVLEGQRHRMLQQIQNEPTNKLLNMNESDFVKYLADEYRVEPLTIRLEEIQVSHAEKMIPAERHPPEFDCRFQKSYPRQVLTFHVPYAGEAQLLKCRPSSSILWSEEVVISSGEIRFEFINFRNDVEALKRERDGIVDRIVKQNEKVTAEVEQFNSQLEVIARQAVSARKALLLKQINVIESLGVTLRKSPEVPETFAVPIAPKKLVIKPRTSEAAYAPHPSLDQATYQNILSILHDTGVAMERNPSTYANRGEEDLRDFLLMTLCTHYPNTTGETFNKKGKTDILVRHDGTNVFVGECKDWRGIKGFHETIDQILGYLTWRDSKAAILCFVENKELGPVLEQISNGTPQHPCCVRLESKRSESWTQFEFRLKSDPTRNVHLAVLCFHFPSA